MKTKHIRWHALLSMLFAIALFGASGRLFAQTTELHGADAVFKDHGISILWAILKGKDESSSVVYMRIIRGDTAKSELSSFSVVARDVFSGDESPVVAHRSLANSNTVTESRAAFSDKAERRFLFYGAETGSGNGKPLFDVYYYAIPDTAPEFLSKDAVEQYLADTAMRMDSAH